MEQLRRAKRKNLLSISEMFKKEKKLTARAKAEAAKAAEAGKRHSTLTPVKSGVRAASPRERNATDLGSRSSFFLPDLLSESLLVVPSSGRERKRKKKGGTGERKLREHQKKTQGGRMSIDALVKQQNEEAEEKRRFRRSTALRAPPSGSSPGNEPPNVCTSVSRDAANFRGIVLGCIEAKFCK